MTAKYVERLIAWKAEPDAVRKIETPSSPSAGARSCLSSTTKTDGTKATSSWPPSS